jgi:PhnB protein
MNEELPVAWIKAINLKVSDAAVSTRFYAEGLGLPVTAPPEGGGATVLDLGSILLVLDADDDGRRPGEGAVLHIQVPNVDAFHQDLVGRGLKPDSAPTDQPWGERDFVLRDPDGYLLTISQASFR